MRNKKQQVYLGLVGSMRKNRLRDPAMNPGGGGGFVDTEQ
jgi:hypothetical protein